jgi:putative DNA primase/helicase
VAKQQIESGLGWKPKRMRAAFKARKSIGEQRKSMGEHRKSMGEQRADKNKESRNSDLSRLNAALLYAAEGWPVVPLHSKTMSSACTCGNADCDKPGRHPRTEHGVRDATTNRALIEKYWDKWPNAKIGIATGVDAGIIAVVIDGEIGRSNLKEREARNTQLPKTVTIRAPQERIYLFEIGDTRLHCPTKRLGDGITILGDGEFVVAPNSIHDPELVRRFDDGRAAGDVEMATAPQWLMNLIGEPTSAGSQSAPSVILVRTSDIVPAKVEWLWQGFIASGRLTGLVGYPGLGKSQVSLDLAATVSTGRDFPGGASNGKAGDVIILSAEDDPADTIVPRLIAAGADLSRIHIVKAVKDGDGERPFNLSVDLDRLEREQDLTQVKLLVIDPASSYLGSAKGNHVNRNNSGDVRTILGRLANFAAKHELAVLAVSHLNKSSGTSAITRIMGSTEWVAVPRAVFLVTEEAGTSRRLFLPLKNNLAPDRVGYAFRIEDRIVADGIKTSAVVWDHDPVTITADEALAAAAKNKKASSTAMDFLQQLLRDGPVDQTEAVRLGAEAGFSKKNLRMARENLGVKSKKEGFGAEGKWVWVPQGGATVLKLVVDNNPKNHTPPDDKQPTPGRTGGSGDNQAPEHAQDAGTATEPGKPEGGPDSPDGGNAA